MAYFLPPWLLLPLARLAVLAFVVMGSLALATPTTHSLFLQAYGARSLPYAWLAALVASGVAAAVLRRALARETVSHCLAGAAWGLAALLAALLGVGDDRMPHWAFALFLWRDVAIVVLLELFWTLVPLTGMGAHAAALYGPLGAAGTLGGVAMGLWVGLAGRAQAWSTTGLTWLLVPLLATIGGLAVGIRCQRPAAAARPLPTWQPGLRDILILVVLSQVAATLLDFRLGVALQEAFPAVDQRTDRVSLAQALTQALTLGLQLATPWWLGRLGRRAALAATPLVLSAAVLGDILCGGLSWVLAAKIVGKSAEVALFRTAKEMLYLPLGFGARTAGKALVDMWGSRAAKAGASVALLGLSLAGRAAWAQAAWLMASAGWLVWALRGPSQAAPVGRAP